MIGLDNRNRSTGNSVSGEAFARKAESGNGTAFRTIKAYLAFHLLIILPRGNQYPAQAGLLFKEPYQTNKIY